MNVTRADRYRLEAIVSDRSAPQKHVWRANIILATAGSQRTSAGKPIETRNALERAAFRGFQEKSGLRVEFGTLGKPFFRFSQIVSTLRSPKLILNSS